MAIENQINLDKYIGSCRSLISESGSKIKPSDFIIPFSNLAQSIIETSINFIDESYDKQKDIDTIDSDILSDQIIIFELTGQIKNFIFLVQDSYIQINKARILEQEEIENNQGFVNYFKKCLVHLEEGITELETFFNNRIKEIKTNKKSNRAFENFVLHNSNPWPEYKSQFVDLKSQFIEIEKRFLHFDDIFIHIQGVKKTIFENIDNCLIEIKNINETFNKLEAFLSDIKLHDQSNLIRDNMFHLEQNIQTSFHIEDFSHNIELDIEYLNEEVSYPIDTQEGKVLTLTLSLKGRIMSWLKNKIYPNLSEIWGKIEVEQNGMRMTLHNLALLESQKINLEDKELLELKEKMEEMVFPFKRKIKKSEDIVYSIIEKIKHSIVEDISLSLLYKENQYFLFPDVRAKEVSSNLVQHKLVLSTRDFYKRISQKLNLAFVKHQHERSLTYSERVVRYIDSQNFTDLHSKYLNLFTAKGYISDTFTVGLDSQISKIEDSVNSWKSGYQGSVLISGNRLIGKTLFGEKIARRFFFNNAFRLNPNMILKIGNNTFDTNSNLIETLNFIIKSGKENCLIWIDDIELWNNTKTSLAQNIQDLDDFVRQHSNKYFVMVTMNTLTKKRAQAFDLLRDSFQTEISLDNYAYKDFQNAISIKHHSTHYQLIDEKGNVISKSDINKIINKIYHLSDGIIGAGIQLWASRCEEKGESTVIFSKSHFSPFPDFLNVDMKILLNAIYLKKRVFETELETIFGNQYPLKYAQIVHKLLSVGVLVKSVEQCISINECMASDISIELNKFNLK